MALEKNFIVKNGLEVNQRLIYADPVGNTVGLGTTNVDNNSLLTVEGNLTARGNLYLQPGTGIGSIHTVVGDTLDYNVGVVTVLSGDELYYNTGVVTSLSGIAATYSSLTVGVATINQLPFLYAPTGISTLHSLNILGTGTTLFSDGSARFVGTIEQGDNTFTNSSVVVENNSVSNPTILSKNSAGTGKVFSGRNASDLETSSVTSSGNAVFANVSAGDSITAPNLYGNNINVTGIATVGGALTVGGAATVGGGLTVTGDVDFGSNLDVVGISTIQSDVYVGGALSVTGNSYFVGMVTFAAGASGTIQLGDDNTDNVVFNADIDSSLIPDDDDSYDLGSNTQQWKDLYINGTANIDSLSADSAAVTDLTDDRIVIAGSGGELEDDANLTFDGTTLSVGVNLDVDGHAELDEVNVSAASTFGGAVDINSNLDVDGHAELDEVNVSAASTFGGLVDINSDLEVSGSVAIGTDSSSSKLQVHGTLGLSASDELESVFPGGRTQLTSNASGFIVNHNDNSDTIFQNQGGERLRITSNGNVGINSTIPKSKLDVVGSANITGVVTAGILTATTSIYGRDISVTGVTTSGSFVKASNSGGFLKADGTEDTNTYLTTESDPAVGAINGIVKADGAGNISAAISGTDYLTPTGDGSGLTGIINDFLIQDSGTNQGVGTAFNFNSNLTVASITNGIVEVNATVPPGGISAVSDDTAPQLGGRLNANGEDIYGVRNLDVAGITTSGSFVKASNSGGFLKADGTEDTNTYLTSYTESDPVVGGINGIVKADGAGNITAASAGVDYLASFTESDPVVGGINGIVKADGAGNITAASAGVDYLASFTESDPVVAAINGIVKSNGTTIAAAVDGTDYISSVSADTTPQLGGRLNANTQDIYGVRNLNVTGIATVGILTATTSIYGRDISVTGIATIGVVTATAYYGDGSNLSNLPGGAITVSTTAPSSPSSGDLWYNPDYARTFIYYDENVVSYGTDAYWVDAAPFNASIQEDITLEIGDTNTAVKQYPIFTTGAGSTTSTDIDTTAGYFEYTPSTGTLQVNNFNSEITNVGVSTYGSIRIGSTPLDSYDATGNGSVSGTDTTRLFLGQFPATGGIENTVGTAGLRFADGDSAREVASATQFSGSFALYGRNSTNDYADNYIYASPSDGVIIGYSTAGNSLNRGFCLFKTEVNGNGQPDPILVINSDDNFEFSGGNAVFDNDVDAANFNSTSDIKLKENIQVIEDPISKILEINGVTFNWKENGKESAGVIAQEVEKVIPQVTKESGDHKVVNYNGLVGLLIETVKEQQALINNLTARVEKLEN